MKDWKYITRRSPKNLTPKNIVEILLSNRNISEKDKKEFLNPKIDTVTLVSVGIEKNQYNKFQERIEKAICDDETVIIFGDYDVDGICASAILWEALFSKSKNVFPYIPDRIDEGYGLSIKGIENVIEKYPHTKVIITVDNGIVAHDAVDFAKRKGIDVIVTDHHVKAKKLPEAYAIIHTTKLCGAAIAWLISKELGYETKEKIDEKLELASLATIADLVPLIGDSRAIAKFGLERLRQTKRLGLLELFKEAKIEKESLSVYTVGHIVAPRLNASGRIQSAMNGLRLLCTNDRIKANEYALLLGNLNRNRQDLTQESVEHAKLLAIEGSQGKVTVVSHESYNPGVIGLIASQLVESYYKPSFVISVGETISKGSARSITGVNIIELLRSVSETLIEAGGHPMAAGFSVETTKIEEFQNALLKKAEGVVLDEYLKRFITIDMSINFNNITFDLYDELQKLEPFGMGNYEPVFAAEQVKVLEVRKIGRDQTHLKLKLSQDNKIFDAVAFGFAEKVELQAGDIADFAFTIDENKWDGKISLQLKIRDINIGV